MNPIWTGFYKNENLLVNVQSILLCTERTQWNWVSDETLSDFSVCFVIFSVPWSSLSASCSVLDFTSQTSYSHDFHVAGTTDSHLQNSLHKTEINFLCLFWYENLFWPLSWSRCPSLRPTGKTSKSKVLWSTLTCSHACFWGQENTFYNTTTKWKSTYCFTFTPWKNIYTLIKLMSQSLRIWYIFLIVYDKYFTNLHCYKHCLKALFSPYTW